MAMPARSFCMAAEMIICMDMEMREIGRERKGTDWQRLGNP